MKLFTPVISYVTALQLVLAFTPGFNSTYLNVPPSDNQLGSFEWLSSGGPLGNTRPWPRRQGFSKVGEGKKTIIPYCFVDKRSYDKLSCKVKSAIQLWSEALGKAGPETEHSLAFLTHPLSNQHNNNPYCCVGYNYGAEGKKLDPKNELKCIFWNSARYPADTLTIHWVDDVKNRGLTSSPMGYDEGSEEGRNSLQISEGNDEAATIAHEIGHTLGMGHEHQRWDRDDYVQFNCKNVKGMKDVFDRARNELVASICDDEIWNFLCNDAQKIDEWQAPVTSWLRGDGLSSGSPLDSPDGFDYDSIMMYPSNIGSASFDGTKDTAVLVKVKKDATGNKYVDENDWQLFDAQRVSEKDAEFVRRFYP